MVSVTHFSKIYKSSPAVTDFSMECASGEIVGILGPNGAGKTTILKAICARHFGTRGTILVNGCDTREETEKVRAMTGFVMEQSTLPGELKVCEYVRMIFDMGAEFKKSEKIVGQTVQDKNQAIARVKEQFSLESVWDKKIRTLSKGFKERVNFAQALVTNPPLLVLDEPASGLDPAQIVNMRKMVKSLKKDHAIILSTHLMQEVDALCDRVYILNNGKCVANGTSEEIMMKTSCDSLEAAFFKLTNE
ncbi:MAG: ABC transporter ATP-binding protein [Treponema sp.]|nr:ABC transporter ATP-binding protein [Treponema sp.]